MVFTHKVTSCQVYDVLTTGNALLSALVDVDRRVVTGGGRFIQLNALPNVIRRRLRGHHIDERGRGTMLPSGY
jgi:hypothetical protein